MTIKPRFSSRSGGQIVDHVLGGTVATVNVKRLNIADALKVSNCIIAALEAEFAIPQIGGQP